MQIQTLPIACTSLKPIVNISPQPLKERKTYSMPPEKVEIFKSLEGWASQKVLPMLKPVEQSWQPQTFLPDSSLPIGEFCDQVKALRDRTKEIPDEYFVVLVGNMITEEALPSYQTALNNQDGIRDDYGASPNPWAVWLRGWSAEENRHGDLLKTYLYLSGRVDMERIERTIHYLIAAGWDAQLENNPYFGYVYTSFQERATFVAHGNIARLAKKSGDLVLAQICGTIAADEKRHEKVYTRIVEKLLEVEPSCAMVAIGDMLEKKIVMPAHLMYDGEDPNLFQHFSAVLERIGVYSTDDFADVLEFLIGQWGLEKLEGLTSHGKKAQDFVCGLTPRIRKFQERAHDQAHEMKPYGIKFSWIFNKELVL